MAGRAKAGSGISGTDFGGGVANVTKLSACVHFGTHMDAPMHFVDGAGGIDGISLDKLVGPALVVDMRGVTEINADNLGAANIPDNTVRILFRDGQFGSLEQSRP